jgi:very-short-patch-repair endonuclease
MSDKPRKPRQIRHPRREAEQIAGVARRQHGHVTRAQLLALGLGPDAIDRRLASGRLFAVHAGVYAVGYRRSEPIARAMAAVLACGPGAVLGHRSAASLWGMVPGWRFPLHAIAPGRRDRPGIRTHRHSGLTRADVTVRSWIPVTSPARTALDVAPELSEPQLTRLVNDARIRGDLKLHSLRELLARIHHHPGAKLLRPFVEEPANPTRSELEDRFVDFCKRHRLPAPVINARVEGYEVDALFEAQKLIVELDGWAYHRDRRSFAGDRERDTVTLAAGYATVRLTWERLTEREATEAQRLRRIIDSRSPS